MNPYDYFRSEPSFRLGVEKTNSKWSRRSVDFVTAGPASRDEGRIARGEYFQPLRANNIPLAIILHGLGDHSVIPCKLLARSLGNRLEPQAHFHQPHRDCFGTVVPRNDKETVSEQ